MSCGLDLQRVMDVTTERTRALTSADASVLELREGDQMVYRAASGTAEGTLGTRLDVHASLSGRSVLEGRILTCVDAETDPRVDREAARRVGARSMLCVPLFHEAVPAGVLKVYAGAPGFFDDEDVSTLELMVGFISAATSNAASQRALQRSEARFRVFAQLASDGIVTADPTGKITFSNRSAARLFGYRGEDDMIGEPIVALMPERYRDPYRASFVRYGRAESAKLAGHTVEATGRRRDGEEFPLELSVSAWQVEDERFVTAIIRDITERKRLETAVLTLARTDHLTGLLNRGAGEDELQRELLRARRHGADVSVVLLDVDHFKRINDKAGHPGGDAVLRRMGELITNRIRGTDIAIRWGGEEFLLVLPETTLGGAVELAESLRRRIESSDFAVVKGVTASFGAAAVDASVPVEQSIARADAKLYEAKAGGRNRVVS